MGDTTTRALAISTQQLNLWYGTFQALFDINLNIGQGIITSMIGPSGCGKSTFLRSVNPHFKYIDLNRRGYMLLDVTRERVVCEWWYVDTVASLSNIETCGVAFEVAHGSNRLQPSAMTTPRVGAPALAP